MKKFLGFMALTMAMLVLPVVAKADTNFAVDCEKSCPTENGKCISACKITASGNTSNITSISVNIDFVADKGIVLKDFKVGDGWTKLSPTDETINVGSDKVQLSFVSSGVTSSNFEIASFKVFLLFRLLSPITFDKLDFLDKIKVQTLFKKIFDSKELEELPNICQITLQ